MEDLGESVARADWLEVQRAGSASDAGRGRVRAVN